MKYISTYSHNARLPSGPYCHIQKPAFIAIALHGAEALEANRQAGQCHGAVPARLIRFEDHILNNPGINGEPSHMLI